MGMRRSTLLGEEFTWPSRIQRPLLTKYAVSFTKTIFALIATAPLDAAGHVNLSPKGYDTLRILSSTEIAYLDLTGSGN